MVCSFGDQNDVAVFRELGLTPFQAIDLDGKMTEVSGPYVGMKVAEARERVIDDLSSKNRIVQIIEKEQDVPVSERGKNPVEIILLKEWYVRQTHIQDRMRELIEDMEFHPIRNKQFLLDWMDNISIDWPISRRRWYHTEVPIWYSEDGEKIITPPAGVYVQPWKENPPSGSRVINRESREDLGSWDELSSQLGQVIGEEKVFDTWMDSSNSNLYVSGYLSDTELFSEAFPTGIRPQGKEIVRTWLYYTLLKSALLFDSPGFKHVWIDGLGMDPWGRKMSKSLGNGIDADSVLECGAGGRTGSWKIRGPDTIVNLRANKIGSECFRLWKACDAQVGDDFQINPEDIEQKYFGVLTKLFNVARFSSQFDVPIDLEEIPTNLAPEDEWILSEFQSVMKRVEKAWQEIDIYTAAQSLKNFSTGVLASHWLEMVKSRLYDGDNAAAWTLHRMVRDLLDAFSPICPFFSHYLSSTLYVRSAVEADSFPTISLNFESDGWTDITESVMIFNSEVWRMKKEQGLSLNSEISNVNVPDSLHPLTVPLTRMHKLSD